MSALRWKFLGLALWGSCFTAPTVVADEPAKDEGPAGIFKQLDANGDGVLTMEEVPADKKTLAERLFRNADKDKDGKLTAAEFKAGLEKQSDPAPQREGTPGTGPFGGRPGAPGQGGGAEQLWKMLDRNGTGSVKASDVPEERRERFTRMLEMADTNKDGAMSKEEFTKFAERMAPRDGTPGRERPEGSARLENPIKEGDKRPDAERRPEARPDGERREGGPRDGDKPAETRREGDRPPARPEGRPEMRREGDRPAAERPEMRREGDRPAGERIEGRPGVPGLQRGPAPAGMFFLLDTDRDGRLSKSEIENAAKVLSKLDRNGDGELTQQELMPELRPDMRRPEGDRPATGEGFRPREGDRPAGDRPAAREGDRPSDRPAAREGDRRPETRDGERRPAGPRDGDKPREGDRPRESDKPTSEKPKSE